MKKFTATILVFALLLSMGGMFAYADSFSSTYKTLWGIPSTAVELPHGGSTTNSGATCAYGLTAYGTYGRAHVALFSIYTNSTGTYDTVTSKLRCNVNSGLVAYVGARGNYGGVNGLEYEYSSVRFTTIDSAGAFVTVQIPSTSGIGGIGSCSLTFDDGLYGDFVASTTVDA